MTQEDHKRLFVAVRLAPEVVSALDAALGGCYEDERIRWVKPENWHVTLQFLGNVAASKVDEVRLACAFGAGRIKPFEVTFSGLGAFPDERRARIVWIGAGPGGEQIASLATAVQLETSKRGFASDDRAFHSHLTVGRAKSPVDVSALVEKCELAPALMRVDEVALFESVLRSDGAHYDIVDTFPLRS